MTYQEILEGITAHRANTIPTMEGDIKFVVPAVFKEVMRKIDEIEWALQALAEKLRDDQTQWDRVNHLFENAAKDLTKEK